MASGRRDELTASVVMTLVLLIASSFTAEPAGAQAGGMQAGGTQALPPAQMQGETQYVSGGIGKDESDAIKQANAEYPLLVEFASARRGKVDGASSGEYVSGADVVITDAKGVEVLHTKTDGPMLLVKVPPGHYSINANWEGKPKQTIVDVTAAGHKHVVMAW